MREPPPEPAEPRTRLGRILREHPEARERLGRAVGGLLSAVIATLAAVALLLIWHMRRRADLIRGRLGEARGGPLADPSDLRPDHDEDSQA